MPILGNYIQTPPLTAVQNSATAIARGHVCVLNSTTNGQLVIRSGTDNLAKAVYIALTDSPGQNKEFAVAKNGDIVWAVCDGAITQGDKVMSGANGGVKVVGSTAGTIYNVVGVALESGADTNYVAILVGVSQFKA